MLRVTLCALLLATTPLAQKPKPPDPQNGMISGRSAVLAWPATLRPDGYPGQYLPVAGCEVHHAPSDEPEKHITFPCGTWFVPKPGRYYEWLEQGDTISVSYSQLLANGIGERGSTSTYPMVPAGYVALREGHGLRDDVVVRYIHLTRTTRAFIRTELGSPASAPVRMQTGPIFGVVFDRKSNDAIAFIRRVELAAAKTTRVVAEKPKSGTSAVYVELKPPRIDRGGAVDLRLQIDGKSYPPDAIVDGYRTYAFWYGVEPHTAKLVANHDKVFYDGPDLTLRAGKITTVRGELKAKPGIKVYATLDGKATLPELSVDIFHPGENSPLRREKIETGKPLRIEALDPAPYRVVLNVPPWKFARTVDLTDGNDRDAKWELAPFAISGTVRVGKTPVRARVGFMVRIDEWTDVKTDDNGVYATTLWLPRDYIVQIHAEGQSAPFRQLIAVDDSGTFDFNLPDTHYTARVRSAADGRPIANASVILNNTWDSADHGRENVVQNVTTDERGEAALPALRSGSIEVTAEAKGFRRAESASYAVEADSSRTLEVALTPIEVTHTLHIELPDGSPAADAELLATTHAGGTTLWRGRTNPAGEIDLPELDAGSLLLIRHPRAASSVRVCRGDEATTWTLAPPLEAFTLRIERHELAKPAQLTMWFGDVPVRGAALAFLTWSSPASDRDGLWTARNLPRQPVRILAWQKSDPVAVAAGAFDALSTVAPYPLPNGFTLRAID